MLRSHQLSFLFTPFTTGNQTNITSIRHVPGVKTAQVPSLLVRVSESISHSRLVVIGQGVLKDIYSTGNTIDSLWPLESGITFAVTSTWKYKPMVMSYDGHIRKVELCPDWWTVDRTFVKSPGLLRHAPWHCWHRPQARWIFLN